MTSTMEAFCAALGKLRMYETGSCVYLGSPLGCHCCEILNNL